METGAARVVTLAEPEYPAQLRAIPAPPPVLHVRGRLLAEDALAVAVVGSRRASAYGLEVAERLARDLAARGVTVVSGLARGIDGAAHRGALAAGGRTVAVLGSGPDVVYPPEHRRLAAAVAEAGAVVSQFPPGAAPLPERFPERNRVIAGLALGVVVVEAAERSGALITARLAADLGREVMAVPGRVTSPLSRGTHALLRDGAALVETWADVVGALPEPWRGLVGPGPAAGPTAADEAGGPDATGEAGRVLAAVGEEPVGIDELVERSGVPAGRAAALLVTLELEGRVRSLDGRRFVRAARS
jgi:DNA processing protein